MPLFDILGGRGVSYLVLRQGLVLRHCVDQVSFKFPEIPLPLQLLKTWVTTWSPLDSFSMQRARKRAITTWGHYQEVTLSISAWLGFISRVCSCLSGNKFSYMQPFLFQFWLFFIILQYVYKSTCNKNEQRVPLGLWFSVIM